MGAHQKIARKAALESAQDYDLWKSIVLQAFTGGAHPGPSELKRAWTRTLLRTRGEIRDPGRSSQAKIKGALSLAQLRIRSLPDGLKVSGHLDLRACTRLVRLGHSTEVKGDLLIGGSAARTAEYQERFMSAPDTPASLKRPGRGGQCPLETLPPNLLVHGDLIIRSCKRLEEVPEDLRVRGSLILIGCANLHRLPKSMELDGDLIIIGSPLLRELPASLNVSGLHISGCGLRELPADLRVRDTLHLEFCSHLRRLSASEGVHNSVRIENCPVEELPARMFASTAVRVRNAALVRCATIFQAPRVSLTRCGDLRAVTGEFKGTRYLSLRENPVLREFPATEKQLAELDLADCHALERLPVGLRIGTSAHLLSLNLRNCRALTEMPGDIKVKGRVELAGSGITRWSRKNRDVNVLWRGRFVPWELIFEPETLSPERILLESNTEIRRLMIEQVGIDSLVRRTDAKVLDADRDPGGRRELLEFALNVNRRQGPLRARFLSCICPSTARQFLLRVPGDVDTCHGAAAWLAGFEQPSDYAPTRET